jgi:AraC-like DNA-binding protein
MRNWDGWDAIASLACNIFKASYFDQKITVPFLGRVMNQACASLYYWNGKDMYIGKFPNNTEHQHHVIQIGIGVTAPFRLQVGGTDYDFRSVIIAPNVPHKVDDYGEWQMMLHIEPYSLIGTQLLATYLKDQQFKEIGFESIKPFLPEINCFVERIHTCERAKILFDDIIYNLIDTPMKPSSVDDRIRAALEMLNHMPIKKISAKALAVAIGLSESHFAHLFKCQIGIPVRRYLLWLRLRNAVEQIIKGRTFTNAAHHAGFSDSAHLSRTFKRMSGMTLTNYLKKSQFIQAVFCPD